MGDVLDDAVLVLEPVVHLLLHVRVVFLELPDSVRLDALYFVSLVLELGVQLGCQLGLSLLPSFLLS